MIFAERDHINTRMARKVIHRILGKPFMANLQAFFLNGFRTVRTPIGVLSTAAFVFALCGVCVHSRIWVLFYGVVAVLVLGLIWPWLTVQGLRGSLAFERTRGREGESVKIGLIVQNRLFWTVWGIELKGGFGSFQTIARAKKTLSGFSAIGSRRTRELCLEFRPEQRGEYPYGGCYITCGFPFGLWEARQSIQVENKLLVWPRKVPVACGLLVGDGSSQEDHSQAGSSDPSGDIAGVRPYRRGDSIRSIHWSQTARHDRLIVCERQTATQPRIQLLLDTNPNNYAGEKTDDFREHAVRLAAGLIERWLDQGIGVDLICNPEKILLGPESEQRPKLLDILARIPFTHGWDLSELLGISFRRSLIENIRIVITTEEGYKKISAGPGKGKLPQVLIVRATVSEDGIPGFGLMEPRVETPKNLVLNPQLKRSIFLPERRLSYAG
jgi:uncharacterized protein (DUF58 family)